MITDAEGIQFLQWCLPTLRLRWSGFRKVRRQVYKRLNRRLKELGLAGVEEYRSYLAAHPAEWSVLDTLCWISISRFYRDMGVFQYVEREVLSQLATMVVTSGEEEVRCWSAGCASGEEPYTLAILWRHRLAGQFPTLRLSIVATDIDTRAIQRAERGCYPASSVKELPEEWRVQAFVPSEEGFCIRQEYREMVTFLRQDIRETAPDGSFHLILCRNLVFTYFDDTLQRETLRRITERLVSGGALVVGKLEELSGENWGVAPWSKHTGIYRKLPTRTRNREC